MSKLRMIPWWAFAMVSLVGCQTSVRPPNGMTIAVVELHEVIQFLEAKEKATRVIPPHLDPARNKELAQKIDRYNHIEGEIRKQRSVLQTRELADRAAKAAADGRALDQGFPCQPPDSLGQNDFPNDPDIQKLQAELKPLAQSLAEYHTLSGPGDTETMINKARETVRKYAEGKFDVVYDSFHGTSFFAENIILPQGQPVVDITQAVIESAK